tara:strand:- start:569 stop:742 length:174 start_codon:yes stop_codon:yes gene_type:complete
MMDIVDGVIRYEAGEMEEEEIVEFFQVLIDTDMLLGLQGHYQRMASDLVGVGLCEDR